MDKRTGYRTKQMLVAPIVDAGGNELIGVIQVINTQGRHAVRRAGRGRHRRARADAGDRLQAAPEAAAVVKTKYDYLVSNAVLSAGEFELASRSGAQEGVDIERC